MQGELQSEDAGKNSDVDDKFNVLSEVPFDRNKNLYGDLTIKDLTLILSICEPISMSIENLNRLKEKGQRFIPKGPLLEIFEYGMPMKN